MDILDENSLSHYGTPRHSGRYPWGSGKNPQRNKNFYRRYQELTKAGLSQKEIADGWKISVTQLRALVSIGRNEQKKENVTRAQHLKEHGYSNTRIAEMMGESESTIRSWLKPGELEKTEKNQRVANALKEYVDKVRYVDVGPGSEIALSRALGENITDSRMKVAIAQLEEQGYRAQNVQVDQMGTKFKTTIKVLTPEDCTYQELKENRFDIKAIGTKTIDSDGFAKLGIEDIKSIDSSRIYVRYKEDGGSEKDGVIELRRGTEDLSLGNANYAQVRIGVDSTHYAKGMAVYSDNVPDGYDIVVNSNKKRGTPLCGEDNENSVLKNMKEDKDNPFGAVITQKMYKDANGNEQLSPLNIVNEEGDWNNWSKNLASQFLSKQAPALAKRQLELAYAQKKDEFDEICRLTNPEVKKRLLEAFSDNADGAAISLKAAAFPGQSTNVLLPINSLKEGECYCSRYENGTQLALVRYPHGGTFEIPIVTVNNNNKEAKACIGTDAKDAIGIGSKTAAQLSGADFDGDTAITIPLSNTVRIKATRPLPGLVDFDTKEYATDHDTMSKKQKGREMGVITNLITDMTIKGASEQELERAVKCSMVIIDAEKHKLDWKQAYKDMGIDQLKKDYQPTGGVSTIISRAKNPMYVDLRQPRTGINKFNTDIETGEKIDRPAQNAKGWKPKKRDAEGNITEWEEVTKQEQITRMEATNDAYTLTSGGSKENPGYVIEGIYAEYANRCKSLANEARKEYLNTPASRYSKEAKEEYADAVASLQEKIKRAQAKAPIERQAQILANKTVQAKLDENPDLDYEHKKKLQGQAIQAARKAYQRQYHDAYGENASEIEITDREWEAIQKGALSSNAITTVLKYANLDKVKERATPRAKTTIPAARVSLIKKFRKSGYTIAEIASAVGMSPNDVTKVLEKVDSSESD